MTAQSKNKVQEVDIGRKIVGWLKDYGWDVYQEVQIYSGWNRADIVAVQNKIIWVIECKTTLSLQVMCQALEWTAFAHYISVATLPARYRNKTRGFAHRVLENEGIGCLEVKTWWEEKISIEEVLKPKLHRRINKRYIMECLTEEHKSYAEAGNAECRYVTPFKITVDKIRKYVSKYPGCSLKELLAHVTTHYASEASAKTAIPRRILEGLIEGVGIEKVNGKWRLYPEESFLEWPPGTEECFDESGHLVSTVSDEELHER